MDALGNEWWENLENTKNFTPQADSLNVCQPHKQRCMSGSGSWSHICKIETAACGLLAHL